jgi:hypothetical protein
MVAEGAHLVSLYHGLGSGMVVFVVPQVLHERRDRERVASCCSSHPLDRDEFKE